MKLNKDNSDAISSTINDILVYTVFTSVSVFFTYIIQFFFIWLFLHCNAKKHTRVSSSGNSYMFLVIYSTLTPFSKSFFPNS